MKHFIIIFGLILLHVNIYAQFGPSQLITSTNYSYHILLEDLDGDGDLDLLTASMFDNEIAWYENIDGMGSFGPKISIDSDIQYVQAIYVADLDGDGYNDILCGSSDTSGDNGKVSWYRNDGQGNFELAEIIASNGVAPMIVHASDIDNDGDIDVLAAGFSRTGIAIFENLDGQGHFGNRRPISSDFAQISSIYTANIDGDNVIDVIATSTNAGVDLNKVVWYKNNGNGHFGSENIISTDVGLSPRSVIAEDLDNDGTIDVVYTDSLNKIVWQSNTNGLGSFGAQQVITTEVDGSTFIKIGDIDQDGFVDIVSSSQLDGKIAWYKNINGSGNFGQQQVIDIVSSPSMILAKDVNSNGVLDIIISSRNNISWYENLTPLSVSETRQNLFSIFPIPATNTISIQSKSEVSKILVYDDSGSLVLKVLNQNILDISKLSSGTYYLKIFDTSNNQVSKKVIKI